MRSSRGTPPIPSPTRVSPLIIAPPRPNSAWFEEDQQGPVGNWRGVTVGSTRSVELLHNVQSPTEPMQNNVSTITRIHPPTQETHTEKNEETEEEEE